jgi:flagellar assembly factor FliW
MRCFQVLDMSTVVETPQAKTLTVRLPLGLLGFEKIKSYWLISNPEEEPFCWLQVPDEGDLAFLVVPPAAVLPDYAPDLSNDDVAYLGIESPEDAWIYNIVTIRPDGTSSVNLKGPIVINRHTLIGKQVVLANSPYPIQHPLGAA